jgi:hypothetical protein
MREGFSLIEALAATVLLAIAMIPIYDMLSSLHIAGQRLALVTQVPFVEATVLTLLDSPNEFGAERINEGRLSVDSWQVEWRREVIGDVQAAGAPYGAATIDLWMEEIVLTFAHGEYRQSSLHHRMGWSKRFESVDAYLETME